MKRRTPTAISATEYLDAHQPGWADADGPEMAAAMRRAFADWTPSELRLLDEPRVMGLIENGIRLAAQKRALQVEVDRLRAENDRLNVDGRHSS